AFALSHQADDAAKAAGAANLLVFHDGQILARNTDAVGLEQSLKEAGLKGKKAVLVGTGGAARGAVLALDRLGGAETPILGSDAATAKNLADALSPQVKAALHPGALADWRKAADGAALLLNASSAGMGKNPQLELALDALPKTALVCDIVYSPLETPLLKQA